MNSEQMRELVKESGLDWHRGYMPLFDGDPTNRYAVLIEAAVAAERERWIVKAGKTYTEAHAMFDGAQSRSKPAKKVRDVIEWHLWRMRHDELEVA